MLRGKTRTINSLRDQRSFRIVDLPGYGYAKVSKSISENWGEMMEKYFKSRQGLIQVVQLVDIRHEPSKQDVQMYNYLKHYGLDGLVVATKEDKLSRNDVQKNLARIRRTLGMGPDDKIIAVSSLKKTGVDSLLKEIGDTGRRKGLERTDMQFIIGWRNHKENQSHKVYDEGQECTQAKKALVIAGIIYLFALDLIPPVLFPIAWIDDLILWIWILYHLRETLDKYWMGAKPADYSKKYKDSIEGVEYEVKEEE